MTLHVTRQAHVLFACAGRELSSCRPLTPHPTALVHSTLLYITHGGHQSARVIKEACRVKHGCMTIESKNKTMWVGSTCMIGATKQMHMHALHK